MTTKYGSASLPSIHGSRFLIEHAHQRTIRAAKYTLTPLDRPIGKRRRCRFSGADKFGLVREVEVVEVVSFGLENHHARRLGGRTWVTNTESVRKSTTTLGFDTPPRPASTRSSVSCRSRAKVVLLTESRAPPKRSSE